MRKALEGGGEGGEQRPWATGERVQSPGQASRLLAPLTWAWSSPGLCLAQSATGEAPEGPDNSHRFKKGTQSLSEEHLLDLVCPRGTPSFRGLHPSPMEPEVISELTSAQPWSPLGQRLPYTPIGQQDAGLRVPSVSVAELGLDAVGSSVPRPPPDPRMAVAPVAPSPDPLCWM